MSKSCSREAIISGGAPVLSLLAAAPHMLEVVWGSDHSSLHASAHTARDLWNAGGGAGGNSGLSVGFIRGDHVTSSKSWADLNSGLDLEGSVVSYVPTLVSAAHTAKAFCLLPDAQGGFCQ